MPRVHVTNWFIALCVVLGVMAARDISHREIVPDAEIPKLPDSLNEDNVGEYLRVLDAIQVEPTPMPWTWVIAAGVGVALVYALSILAHELGHYLTARRLGIGVEGITLNAAGGFVEFVDDARLTLRRFVLIVASGPLVTALLLGGAYVLYGHKFSDTPAGIVAERVVDFALVINAVALVVNLLPIRGLDGWLLLKSARLSTRSSRTSPSG